MIRGVTREDGYPLDNQHAQAGTRFEPLATLFNPSTFRHIEALGITRGWRCWEVGAGGTQRAGMARRAGRPRGLRAGERHRCVLDDQDRPTELRDPSPRRRRRGTALWRVRPGARPPAAGPRCAARPGAGGNGHGYPTRGLAASGTGRSSLATPRLPRRIRPRTPPGQPAQTPIPRLDDTARCAPGLRTDAASIAARRDWSTSKQTASSR